MRELSLKGILAGIGTSLLMSIPLGVLLSFYFLEIYNDVAPSISTTSENNIADLPGLMLYHPLSFAFFLIAIVTAVAFPSYVAALVADKGFIGNALSVGIFVLICNLLMIDLIVQHPVFFAVMAIITLLASYAGGAIRKIQVK